MRVLITGAAGLYGVHTVAELVSGAKTGKIFALDDMSRSFLGKDPFIRPEGFAEKVQIMKRDFRTLKAKEIDTMKLDVIVHFAAHVSIDESMVNPQKYFDNNELGTFNLCRELLAGKTKPALIYASSPEVYGNPLHTPMDELHPLSPRSVYAVTKLAAEKHCLSMFEWDNYPVNVIRNFNTFGENQNLWGYSAVIPAFISRALKGQPLQVSGDGTQTRDFLYVKDAARAYRILAEKGGSLKGEIFNIGTGKQTSVNELAEKIMRVTGSESEIEYVKPRGGDLRALEAGISKISSRLNWSPKYGLEQGLKETAEWYKKFVK